MTLVAAWWMCTRVGRGGRGTRRTRASATWGRPSWWFMFIIVPVWHRLAGWLWSGKSLFIMKLQVTPWVWNKSVEIKSSSDFTNTDSIPYLSIAAVVYFVISQSNLKIIDGNIFDLRPPWPWVDNWAGNISSEFIVKHFPVYKLAGTLCNKFYCQTNCELGGKCREAK